MHVFRSNKIDELKREKEKNDALRSIFPAFYEGVEDDTVYVLTDDSGMNGKPLNDGIFAKEESKNAKVVNKEPVKSEFNMDPWKFEKMADRSQYGIKIGLDGKLDTVPLQRIDYGDNFNKINNDKFESLIPYTLKYEGGYSNRKNDKGGETNYGITKIFYDEYKNKVPGTLSSTIKDITLEDAKKLYKAQWDRYNLGYVRDKRKALLLHDYMVNSGARGVVKRLQGILNSRGYNLKVDGNIGKETLEAINNSNFDTFAIDLQNDRKNWYDGLVDSDSTQMDNIKGWFNRLNLLSDTIDLGVKFKSKHLNK